MSYDRISRSTASVDAEHARTPGEQTADTADTLVVYHHTKASGRSRLLIIDLIKQHLSGWGANALPGAFFYGVTYPLLHLPHAGRVYQPI